MSRWSEGSYASKGGRDRVDPARAALAAGADRNAWYPRAALEWGDKRERLLQYHGL